MRVLRGVGAGLLALSVCVCPVVAESPKPFPDFSAKRVKPPKPGQSKRINVQIQPQAQSTESAASADAGEVSTKTDAAIGSYPWFWKRVSPNLSASGPGRLEPALIALTRAPTGQGVRTPRLDTLRSTVNEFGTDILLATIGTQVSPALALAVITVESGGQADAVSSAGAQGLMQLMPATAERFGVEDVLVAKDNIGGGVRFLDYLMKEFDRDPILVLAGYNAGENSIPEHQGVPPYAETRDYVPKVLAAFQVAKALCVTPPELITDGCVFARP